MRVKLKDYITIQNGYAFKSKSFQKDGIPVVRITNVENGFFNLDKVVYYQEDKKLSKFFIKKGDILLALTGDDKTLKLCINNYEKKMYLNQRVAILRSNSELEQKYLYYAIKRFSKNILEKAKGIAQKNIGVDDINSLQIPLQPLPKQKAIAQKLDLAQKLIDLRKESITKLDALAKSVFVEMFGDPVENEMGWEKVELGSVIEIDAPMVEPKDEKYANLLHIGPDRIAKNTGKLLPALTAKEENLISKKFLFNEEYLLYSKIRPYLNKVAMVDFVGLCSADMYPLKPILDKVNKEYLWQLLLSPFFIRYTETLPDRASIPKLNRKELLKFEFNLPPITLQNKFAQTIQKIEVQKALYEAELVKLEEGFEGLLAESFA